jgi:hypothetical protein
LENKQIYFSVNLLLMTENFRKPNKNSSGVEVGMNQMFSSVGKTNYQSSKHITIRPLFPLGIHPTKAYAADGSIEKPQGPVFVGVVDEQVG